jgi:hypothetical protein
MSVDIEQLDTAAPSLPLFKGLVPFYKACINLKGRVVVEGDTLLSSCASFLKA